MLQSSGISIFLFEIGYLENIKSLLRIKYGIKYQQ